MIRDHDFVFFPSPASGRGRHPTPLPLGEGWGEGGFGKAHQLFGDKLNAMIEELNETLAA
jgi:hypothetical protein